MSEETISRGRRQVVVLFGIAFASLGIAWLTYFLVSGSGVMGTTNHGEFVKPARTIDSLATEGEPFDTREKWWLWYVAPSCDATCAKTMHDLKSVHVLLNRDSTRVARAMFTTNAEPGQLIGSEQDKVELLSAPAELEPGVYIVDPIGNLVLRYPIDTPPKPVLEDLKKLLRLSQIG